jgi:hypothetical protein
MAFLSVPANARHIGHCIYCGYVGDDLSKEHAIPYALNGPWTLLKASCPKCNDITHRFERNVAQSLWLPVRTVLSMQTRHPEKRPKSLDLVIEQNGEQKTIKVLPNEYPLYLPVLILPPPKSIALEIPSQNNSIKFDFIHIAGPTFEQVSKAKSAEFVGARLSFYPQEFARTLAKIAFTAAVYTIGTKAFTNSPIRKIILGEDRQYEHWVGCWNGDCVNEPNKGLHAMQIKALGTEIHVILRLFAQFNAPEYHIILGSADPEFVNSKDWPWK